MADYTFPDGKEITFDLNKITRREYMSLFDNEQKDEEADELIGRTCGLTAEEIGAIGYMDWRRLMQAFFKRARAPLSDPNV